MVLKVKGTLTKSSHWTIDADNCDKTNNKIYMCFGWVLSPSVDVY